MCESESLDNTEGILKTLGSETRLRILVLLSKSESDMRFSDIARALDIHKSTLEDHLRKLVDYHFVSQHDGKYTANINTEYALSVLDICNNTTEAYFSTHNLSIPDKLLRYEFTRLNPEVLGNMLTLVDRLQNELYEQPEYIRVGGALDMDLETALLEIWKPDFTQTDSEFVFSRQIIESLKGISFDSVLMQSVSTNVTRLFCMEKICNIGYGFTDQGGALFLPDLDNKLDFSQCLLLQGHFAVDWFNRLHRSLKEQAVEIDLSDLL
ncbi:MAG: ArsR family transcriptional regulator [Candidatus Lokiarchaeota archaeon]|nr:ArsR family transcriptional regulator [Candidatus Lokiarchaeota archaeon]